MDKVAQDFWDGCAQTELRFQSCTKCGKQQFYPRPFCAACGHDQLTWKVSCGSGAVYSLTQIIRAPSPAFQALVPYNIVLVTLDEGILMMGHGSDDLRIDARVTAQFRPHLGLALPYFKRAAL